MKVISFILINIFAKAFGLCKSCINIITQNWCPCVTTNMYIIGKDLCYLKLQIHSRGELCTLGKCFPLKWIFKKTEVFCFSLKDKHKIIRLITHNYTKMGPNEKVSNLCLSDTGRKWFQCRLKLWYFSGHLNKVS